MSKATQPQPKCPCCGEPLRKVVTIGTRDAARSLRVEVGDEVCSECYDKA